MNPANKDVHTKKSWLAAIYSAAVKGDLDFLVRINSGADTDSQLFGSDGNQKYTSDVLGIPGTTLRPALT